MNVELAETAAQGVDALSVSFASDINPLLAEAFLEEAPVHAGRFSEVMGRLAGDNASLDDVVLAQRVAHSLKGSASITGVSAIASVTHQAEDILDWLADSGELPPQALRGTLVETADCVAAMVDALSENGPLPHSTGRVLAQLQQWRDQHTSSGVGIAASQMREAEPLPDLAATPTTVPATAQVEVDPLPTATMPAATVPPTAVPAATVPSETVPPVATAEPDAVGESQQAQPQTAAANLRVPVTLVDRLLRLAGELAISNVQAQGAQQRMNLRANSLREQYHLLQQRLSDLQDVVEIRGVPSRSRHEGKIAEQSDGEFDPLELDEYNELHSKNTALAEAVTDFCELALGMRPELVKMEDTVADQQRISKEFSDSVLSARMVPVGQVEQRLQRAVRETCRATGKQAALVVTGGDIPVDGDVLNALFDPLLHALRNAVDHGIEAPARREAEGKGVVGALEVRFSRDGENVLIEVCDDGAGFDIDGICEVAQQRGILASDERRAERELLQMAVGAGFTTRREASEISGRGIGMDVVQRAVIDLKGSMDIASTLGKGATISLRVPLTLISMHVLLVRAGTQIFGVPSASLQQVLISDRSALRDEGNRQVFTLDENDYAVRRMQHLVGDDMGPGESHKQISLLLFEADSGPTAVVVDQALAGRYLLVNSLGPRVPRPAGVIGASILGDGGVAPVLDLRELLRRQPVATSASVGDTFSKPSKPQVQAAEVLVVDDSLTARRMLTIAIGDAGYRVRTAIDGLDAVEAIEDAMPDLLITDLEMPRMNGLELAAHLRADSATQALPILMVTSRSTDKHRGQAQAAGINVFITKPYANQDLLDLVERSLA